MEYLPNYNREQMRRHDVLPGITGLVAGASAQCRAVDEEI